MEEMVGLYEIAEMANVTTSAVSNWRIRFADFPLPSFDLKSGPVFRKALIQLWLSKKHETTDGEIPLYDQLAAKRGDAQELRDSVARTVRQLLEMGTSAAKPGILLGRVQSGKTRAFLGVIAKAFDEGYDVAVVLTKGTTSLARQTLSRVCDDFEEFIEADHVLAYDIMNLPRLTPYDLSHKLVLVSKKEDDNLDRVLKAFETDYPELANKKLLIIDDEADLASVSFQRRQGVRQAGVISQQIDRLRSIVPDTSFLQVTATPYSLYLQPDEPSLDESNALFLPKRPAFTELLPSHDKYVGGDQYFQDVDNPDSPAHFLYREVSIAELDALKKPDGRRLNLANILHEKNAAMLLSAIVTFVVGGSIRRLQQASEAKRQEKYSFLFHTEQTRASHDWQLQVAEAIRAQLEAEAAHGTPEFHGLIAASYHDLKRSVDISSTSAPSLAEVTAAVSIALTTGQLMVTKVNSDQDIEQLLNREGQLHLRNPFNMFIGGQILDRGITIKNLIGFYYGRNPKKFQQDTVLQHSRMYGARSTADLAVTRFFAPLHIYKIMRKINDFDSALRGALADRSHKRGVYFVQRDPSGILIPCAPNKLMFSQITSLRPGQRLLPIGFNSLAPTAGSSLLKRLDRQIETLCGGDCAEPKLIDLHHALDLLKRTYEGLVFDRESDSELGAHLAALEHLSKTTSNESLRGKVWLLTARDRNTSRLRASGRPSNAPDTKQQADSALSTAEDIPLLALFRQNGSLDLGWRGVSFWWPVVVTPRKAATAVCADASAA
jgi:hypothetical protein